MRKNINEVFTPRRSEVNSDMYAERHELEVNLFRALNSNSHVLLFGASGNGKSWLYKKVMNEKKIEHVIANCANADRIKSLTDEICNSIIKNGYATKTGFKEEKITKVEALVASGTLANKSDYDIKLDEPLLQAFNILNPKKKRKKIIVLDNLETIYSSDALMEELSNIVILLDDDRYAQYNITFLIVGTQHDVLKYFSKTKNLESVANRITEVDRVSSLEKIQVEFIIKQGFTQLDIFMTENAMEYLSAYVWDITLGIPQRVHEYCESLAYEVEDNNWKYEKRLLKDANFSWLKKGFRAYYGVVESHLNCKNTKVSRKNQVIYSIGKTTGHQFDSKSIEKLVRKEFPASCKETKLAIGSILNELTHGTSPLLIKNEKTNKYTISDSRYQMCIKVMLEKLENEKVEVKNLVR